MLWKYLEKECNCFSRLKCIILRNVNSKRHGLQTVFNARSVAIKNIKMSRIFFGYYDWIVFIQILAVKYTLGHLIRLSVAFTFLLSILTFWHGEPRWLPMFKAWRYQMIIYIYCSNLFTFIYRYSPYFVPYNFHANTV